MFAIAMTEENLEKIFNSTDFSESDKTFMTKISGPHHFFVTGYVGCRGQMGWTYLPDYFFKVRYDFDPVKIMFDWDLIVPKPLVA